MAVAVGPARGGKHTQYDEQEVSFLARVMRKWAALPLKVKIAFVLFVLALVGAWAIILGSVEIRSGYQRKKGHDAYALAFLALQLGTFIAAVFLSYGHIHPYAGRWRDLTKRLNLATPARVAALNVFSGLVGTYNGLLDRREAMLAQAGHLVGISENDVLRQISLGRHHETLASPEPVAEKLFVKEPEGPNTRDGLQLTGDLIGITELPRFERKSTGALHTRQETLRAELNKLRADRRAVGRASFTPLTTVKVGDREFEAETPDPETAEGNGHVKVTEPGKGA